jgi:Fe-S-cluster containining protein
MDVVSDDEFFAGSGKLGIDLLNIRQESFVNSVYSSVDKATGCELNRLFVEEGVIPTCQPGCFHCCGQHILTNIEEAKALAHYIKREFSQGQIEDLRIRTQKWHEWDGIRSGRHQAGDTDGQLTSSTYYYCPMLVDGQCSAYSMRPLICRTHFVCSDPPACRPFYDPNSIQDNPVALASVIVATNPFSVRIRARIENAGFDFNGSIMLLPHWLALEMDWDFNI